MNCIIGNIDSLAVLVKRWGISFEDAVDNPDYRFQVDNLIVHPQYHVSICYFFFTHCLHGAAINFQNRNWEFYEPIKNY